MRLLALADIHGHFDQVARIAARVGPVEAIVVAGDLTTRGTPADVARAVAVWSKLAPRLLAVAGNMDSPAIDAELERLGVSLNGRCAHVGEVTFFGCSASPESIATPYEIPESEIAARLQRGYAAIPEGALAVCVPHAPPRGLVDGAFNGIHSGSRAVREFIERVQPALVICGHIHEARGQARLGKTLVVNCGEARKGHYVVVELSTDTCTAQML